MLALAQSALEAIRTQSPASHGSPDEVTLKHFIYLLANITMKYASPSTMGIGAHYLSDQDFHFPAVRAMAQQIDSKATYQKLHALLLEYGKD